MFRHLLVWFKSESFATLALLAALFFSAILVILVVYPPIHEAVMLRYYYTPEEIRRDNLYVVEIVGKRDIIYSNGERRAYETGLKVLFAGIAGGLTLAWVAVGNCAITRFKTPVSTGPARRVTGRDWTDYRLTQRST